MGTRKNFFEMHRQLGHDRQRGSPALVSEK